MAFSKDDRVQIHSNGYGVAKGSIGTVQTVYGNGNLRVLVTHKPGCVPREVPKTIPSVSPNDVSSSACKQ